MLSSPNHKKNISQKSSNAKCQLIRPCLQGGRVALLPGQGNPTARDNFTLVVSKAQTDNKTEK